MKTTNNSTLTPSLRVLQDVRSETEYLQEHPELENVFTFHCYKDLPRSAIYFDRNGDIGLCYYHWNRKKYWRIVRYNNLRAPALIKKYKKVQYSHIEYRNKSKKKHIYVHQIIARLFVEHDDIFANELDHLDGNIYNNHYDNLEYVTHEENIRRYQTSLCLKKNKPIPWKYQTPQNYLNYLQTKNSKK